ncbi:MAG: hypothetical protein AAF202_06540 [Pseudomonadota bacterium]
MIRVITTATFAFLFANSAFAHLQTNYHQYLEDIQEIVQEGMAQEEYPNAEICNEAALEYETTGALLAYDHLDRVESSFLQYELCIALGAEKWVEQYTHAVKGRYCGYYCDEEDMGGNGHGDD